MEEKLRVAMFGQKRLLREGGIEIVIFMHIVIMECSPGFYIEG